MSFPFKPLSVRILKKKEVKEILEAFSLKSEDLLPKIGLKDKMWKWLTPEGGAVEVGNVVRIEKKVSDFRFPYSYRIISNI